MRHIILISGKDSLAAAFVQTALCPGLDYEYVSCDTGAEYPETYEWLCRVEQKTGWRILRMGRNLIEIIAEYGGFLPGVRSRYCTRQSKIEPIEKYLAGEAATVYYGLRADEVRTGYIPLGKSNITPEYPLQTAGIDLRGVYAICDAQGLMPPAFFWAELYERVAAALVEFPGWQEKLTRGEWAMLFSWRSRPNCFFCYFQRRYEWAGLYQFHPELFTQAEAMEKDDYTFSQGHRLSEYRDPFVRDSVLADRARAVVKIIGAKYQTRMFEWEESEIAMTSCGLLCGK